MRKWLLMFVAVGLALAPCAFAQPAVISPAANQPQTQPASAEAPTIPVDQQATKEQLRKLFEVMRMRQQFDAMMKMLPSLVQQQVRSQMQQMTKLPGSKPLSPGQQAAFDKLMQKYMAKAQAVYPVDEMIDDAIAIYQRHMSRKDVDAYIAFFSSPPGQDFLDAQPQIMKEYMPVAMKRAQDHSKELYAELAEDLQEMMKADTPAK